MTLTQLRYFAAIADSGLNITVAAMQMHATQSGLSKQLKQLEDELGFLLFTRRARNLTALTPAGQRVLEHARIVLAETANIRALAANLRRDTQGELHIATTHTQARYALPQALAELKKRFPQVAVHLAPGGDKESLARLKQGEAEIAIISTGGTVPAGDLVLPLYRWERVVVVPRQHPLTRLGRPLVLADLVEQPLISYESSRESSSSLRRAFAEAGLEPNIALTARDGDLIKTYVRAGMGVGIVAEMVATDGEEDLAALSGDGLFPTCTTWLLLRRDRLLRDYSLALIGKLLPHVARSTLRGLLSDGGELEQPVPHWRDRHGRGA